MAINRLLLSATAHRALLESLSRQRLAVGSVACLSLCTSQHSPWAGHAAASSSFSAAASAAAAVPPTAPQLRAQHADVPSAAQLPQQRAGFSNAGFSTATITDSDSVAAAMSKSEPGPPTDSGPLPFSDPKAAFAAHSNTQIMRSLAVFTICGIKPLVKYADTCLRLAKKLVGATIVNGVVKRTFFKHFCAGEDGETIKPTLSYLHNNGIGGILDYAAENDVDAEGGPASRQEPHDLIVARIFDYEGEAACDGHMHTFLKCIRAAAAAEGQGFAAIKVTALGQPKLLERVSASLVAIHNLFRTFDADLNGVITRDEFEKVYTDLFDDGTPARMKTIFKYLDRDDKGSGVVDYLSWSRRVKLSDIPLIVKHCRTVGPVALTALNNQELQLLQNMLNRLSRVAETAAESNVRLMIDAEHSYFQPAIDHAAMEMQRKYNKSVPTIYNTYQCYLKDSHDRLVTDMERARREGFCFGAKLVRGAYMFLERDRAAKLKYPSPIHDTIEDTHANYERCVEEVLERVAGEGAEVMVATHNQGSIEHTVQLMAQLGIEPPSTAGVFFGQLLGMADHLTFTLGRNGYRGYKYVPFGPVDEVMPYLIRRAQENSDLMGGVGHEMSMLRRELARRLLTGNPVTRMFARS